MGSGKKNTSLLFAKSYKNHQAHEKDYKNWQGANRQLAIGNKQISPKP